MSSHSTLKGKRFCVSYNIRLSVLNPEKSKNYFPTDKKMHITLTLAKLVLFIRVQYLLSEFLTLTIFPKILRYLSFYVKFDENGNYIRKNRNCGNNKNSNTPAFIIFLSTRCAYKKGFF